MNRVQVLREYNEFLKEHYHCDFDELLLNFLEKTCIEVSEDEPIERLNLSMRATNILLRANIRTVGQLLPMSQTELMKVRNMGRKSLDEINEKVRQIKEQKSAVEKDNGVRK